MDSDHALSLCDVSRAFVSRDDPGRHYTAVADTTPRIAPGEFVSVAGPSGIVTVRGEKLAGINRMAGYLFQADALMPWKSAFDDIIVGSPFRGAAPSVAREHGIAWLARVGPTGFGDRYPHQLSGGMRKRVAWRRR
jgi:NitT/TauT family transport system ATP-binding protein